MRVHDARRFSLALFFLVAAVWVVGCGSRIEFESEEERERFEAALDQSQDLGGPFELTSDEEDCVAEEGNFDADAMVAMLADTSPEGELLRVAFGNAIFVCVDDVTENEGLVEQLRTNLISGIGPGSDVDTIEAKCTLKFIAENSDDFGRTLMIGNGPNDVTLMLNAAEECFDAETFAFLQGDAGTGPQNYGDDAGFDLLYDACGEGDEAACDLLYWRTSINSEYSNFAAGCAGRSDGLTDCWEGIDYLADGTQVDPASPGLPPLMAACEEGDMIACDLLFLNSSPGSAAQAVANSCGGKTAVPALPDCRTRFP